MMNFTETMLSKEVWKDVVIEQDGVKYDFSKLYQVSNLGRVKSVRNNIILKQSKTHNGYLRVSLYKNGERLNCRVQRLVAFAFIDIPTGTDVNKLDVNHINEDKEDNRLENLEWCTTQYNNEYSHGIKIQQYT